MNQKKLNFTDCYYMYGMHAVTEALRNENRIKTEIFYLSERILAPLQSILADIPCIKKEKQWFSQIFPNQTHQGLALKVQKLSPPYLLEFIKRPSVHTLLMLDHVVDPHNIGAILRSCAAFDADGIILQHKNSPTENATIAKVASGALEHIPLFYETNLAQTVKLIKNNAFWCYGLDPLASETLEDFSNSSKNKEHILWILGAEGKGLRPLIQHSCDSLIRLPLSKKIESINVSNAAAIVLYHHSQTRLK